MDHPPIPDNCLHFWEYEGVAWFRLHIDGEKFERPLSEFEPAVVGGCAAAMWAAAAHAARKNAKIDTNEDDGIRQDDAYYTAQNNALAWLDWASLIQQ